MTENDNRRTLRQILPAWETDTMIPLWLVITIMAAATSEVWTIGSGVFEVYQVYVGWAIAVTIASAQAMSSMLTSRAMIHNASARRVTKAAAWPQAIKLVAGLAGRKLPQRRVFDAQRSDPRLNLLAPLSISIGSGVASAVTSYALYDILSPSQGALNVILAVVAPAGSLAAALLNGVFSYGEQAVAARPATSVSKSLTVAARSTKKTSKGKSQTPQTAYKRSPVTDPALAGHLKVLSAAASNGRLNGQPFSRRQAE